MANSTVWLLVTETDGDGLQHDLFATKAEALVALLHFTLDNLKEDGHAGLIADLLKATTEDQLYMALHDGENLDLACDDRYPWCEPFEISLTETVYDY